MPVKPPLGQHFLIDTSVIDRILDAFGIVPGERVIEIGPGRGALTKALLRAGMEVDAIEVDPNMIRVLQDLSRHHPGLTIHQADALNLDLAKFTDPARPLRLIGNLPYQISTPLLLHLATQLDRIRQMTFMLQREVVARIDAQPGSKDFGRLSIALQLDCDVDQHFDVPPEAFAPPPRVMSSVLTMWPRSGRYVVTDRSVLEELVRVAFQQRRKTLRNALAGHVEPATLDLAGIDSGLRAERLSIEDFVRLANLIAK